MKKGLPAIYDKDTEIMIVGTFPGEKSLTKKEYYTDGRNQFWYLVGQVLEKNIGDKNIAHSTKMKVLLAHKIGLWDVISECERDTSSDNKIRNPSFNDFNELDCPKLRLILTNGKKAHDKYFHEKNFPENIRKGILISSSTNRRVCKEDKLANWRELLK